MPARIHVFQRIVPTIAVAVQRLGIARRLHKGIGLDEPPQLRIVVPGVVEVQPTRIQPLAGELLGDIHRPGALGDGAEGQIADPFNDLAGGVGDDAGGA